STPVLCPSASMLHSKHKTVHRLHIPLCNADPLGCYICCNAVFSDKQHPAVPCKTNQRADQRTFPLDSFRLHIESSLVTRATATAVAIDHPPHQRESPCPLLPDGLLPTTIVYRSVSYQAPLAVDPQ